jgi:hypothetical protein
LALASCKTAYQYRTFCIRNWAPAFSELSETYMKVEVPT